MKNLLLILCLCAPLLAQDLAVKKDDKPKEKPPVTSATLTPEEIKEGKDIITEAQKLATKRETANKVANDRVNSDSARVLAYEARDEADDKLNKLQAKMNDMIKRAQDRTGCKDCGIDLDKGTLSAVPPAK